MVTEKPKPIEPKPTPTAKKPQPLPPELVAAWEKAGLSRKDVAAWEKAGFTAGWMGPDKESGFIILAPTLKELDTSKSVPAFRPRGWKLGVLVSLPAPTKVFGLDRAGFEITDEGLKEVAQLHLLTSLDLRSVFYGGNSHSQITDAGVAGLQKALPKCKIRR